MNREDFAIFDTGIIYFDNAATTMKPKSVVDATTDYYTKYTSNAHRGDYDNSLKVDIIYDGVREKVRIFINAKEKKEVIFTNGSTESFNMIVFGFMANYLHKDDEVIIDQVEHASNVLPWMVLSKRIGFKLVYPKMDNDAKLSVDAIKECITSKTKVISIAHITNTIGDVRDVKSIGQICHDKNILFMVDATQSVGHMKVDVQENNIDFMGFSAHKMLGPTGVGVLYGKKEYLEELVPLEYGGDMNEDFASDGEYSLKELPQRLEAGTRNIAGVIGFGEAITYLDNIGLDNIHKYELELRKYLVDEMSKIPNIKIYNKDVDSGIVLFNVDKYFSQDVSIYLNTFKICIRAGNHCVKMLHEVINDNSTCRVSLYFYNTKEEIDVLLEALKHQDRILDTLV